VGIDLVAMSVNDLGVTGADPLFFLDYIATAKIEPAIQRAIVAGVAEGCRQAGCALVGGETAQMPGFYHNSDYDMAGTAVGVVERDRLLNGKRIRVGDALIGLASTGLHSNGYSLVRQLLDAGGHRLNAAIREIGEGKTLGEVLLVPTRIYTKAIAALLEGQGDTDESRPVHGFAHITGGAFYENIPRVLPMGTHAHIDPSSWDAQPIFRWLQREGNIETREMYRTFNMGVALVAAVDAAFADEAIERARAAGVVAWHIGEVIAGDPGVTIAGVGDAPAA
jgi:phosphoribosylformylglycinamidine cyclo-ligase